MDDDESVLQGLRLTVRTGGFRVEVLSDPCALPALLESEEYDAILSDIRMPGLDGLGVLQAVRERCPEVPVLLATGGGDMESAIQALEGGAFRYLLKPVDPAVVRAALGEAVRVRRERAAREAAFRASADARRERSAREQRFERALAARWIAYQPIVDWRGNRLAAYEMLLRSTEPGLTSPLELLATARDLGRLSEVGRLVRSDVAATVPRLPEHVDAFVNIDPADLADPDLVRIDAPLSRVARRVVLEITERASLSRVSDISERIHALRRLGFRIAIDDLGAGFAALSSFALVHPEIVKVDMSLVRAIDGDRVRQKIVHSIVRASHDLGTKVVAEGIETDAERDTLAEMGVDLLQGYLLGRPSRAFASAANAQPRLRSSNQ